MQNGTVKTDTRDLKYTNVATPRARVADRGADQTEGAGSTRVIGELARELAGQPDLDATVRSITAAAVAAVPGAAYAGLSRVVRRGRIVAHAFTDKIAGDLERLQAGLQHGPSIMALRQHRSVSIAEMASERRWPAFTEEAVRRGVGSMLSVQLFVNRKTFGALNLYAAEPGAFTAHDEALAEAFAAHAAIALHFAENRQGLSQAIASRDVIGQAKGLLMVRHGITAAQAFDILVAASQRRNRKLVDVARRLVDDADHQPRNDPSAVSPASAGPGIKLRTSTTIAGISGEIDESNVADVGRYVAGLMSTCRTLVLDLSEVEFISVAGLHLLESIDDQCATAELEWVLVTSDAVDRLLRLLSRGDGPPIAVSVATALDRLTGSTTAVQPPWPITPPSVVRC